jgi:hypothetical protein
MSDVYLVKGKTLTAIADVIRQLAPDIYGTDLMTLDDIIDEGIYQVYNEGYSKGVLSGGGGSGSSETAGQIVDGTITEYSDSSVTEVRSYAFAECKSLLSVTLRSVTSITGYSFYYCTNLVTASIPNATDIGNSAFYGCANLALSSLPEILTAISTSAFEKCTKLAITSIPKSVTKISNYAFSKCTGLTTITFKGTPTKIDGAVFRDCTNLTTINVPWAEGAVANAPWGATNATINYNYTEG